MATEGLDQLLLDGIHAAQGAGAVASDAAADIRKHATAPELQAELRHGSEIAERWRQRLEAAERMAGGSSSAPTDSEIMTAIHHTGEKIAKHATTDAARDLGIVATGQLALHYHIAAFGTLASYANELGLADVAAAMGECLAEAREEDERHTKLAGTLVAA